MHLRRLFADLGGQAALNTKPSIFPWRVSGILGRKGGLLAGWGGGLDSCELMAWWGV
jgi:hypothetical protein